MKNYQEGIAKERQWKHLLFAPLIIKLLSYFKSKYSWIKFRLIVWCHSPFLLDNATTLLLLQSVLSTYGKLFVQKEIRILFILGLQVKVKIFVKFRYSKFKHLKFRCFLLWSHAKFITGNTVVMFHNSHNRFNPLSYMNALKITYYCEIPAFFIFKGFDRVVHVYFVPPTIVHFCMFSSRTHSSSWCICT